MVVVCIPYGVVVMMSRAKVTSLTLIILTAFFVLSQSAPAQTLPQRSPHFIPLGVYFAWEGLNTIGDKWQWVEQALTDMSAHHINTVWLVNCSTSVAREFAVRAASHDVYVIPNPPEINGRKDVYSLSSEEQQARVAALMAFWGDAPAPVAWGHYDEPGPEHAESMSAFLQSWNAVSPHEPVTVVTFGAVPASSLSSVGLAYLCADVYMFFYSRLSNAEVYSYWSGHMNYLTNSLAGSPTIPWVMGQTFQDVKLPLHRDAEEHIVIEPGGAMDWRMPSPAETRWQIWTSFAAGAKGYFNFIYAYPPLITSAPDAHVFPEGYDTGAPTGLATFPSLHSTPTYEAATEAYGRVAANQALIASLEPLSSSTDLVLLGTNSIGTALRVFQDPATGKKYAYLVAGFAGPENQTLALYSSVPNIWLIDVFSDRAFVANKAKPGALFSVPERSGDAALLEIHYDVNEDSDGEGLPDLLEYQLHTDPSSPDTDGDGYSDMIEYTFGYSPTNPNNAPPSVPLKAWPLVVAMGAAALQARRRKLSTCRRG